MTHDEAADGAADDTVNIGILAHVDAGKTTLTERLLFETRTITRLGSVDEGTTQTDSDAIERRRGITIRAAVAALRYGSLQVNLIDTPGHAEFVAEVERAVGVLDGAVLVVSAVEGIQAQTRVLARTLRALRLPTLVFVNKVDRAGARPDELVAEARDALSLRPVPLHAVRAAGTGAAAVTPALGGRDEVAAAAEALAEVDDDLLGALVAGREPDAGELWPRLARHVAEGAVQPVLFGSARQGRGVADLLVAVDRLLPRTRSLASAAPRGTVFAVERGPDGERVGYLRLFEGRVRERERLTWHRLTGESPLSYRAPVTGLTVLGDEAGAVLGPGDIGRIRGVPDLRVGDRLGEADAPTGEARLARPTLEAVVSAREPRQAGLLHSALTELSEQDPLINARTLGGGRVSVLLYGEVQKEVIAERLLTQFGVAADFAESQIIHLERPTSAGSARVELGRSPFVAGVGLRVGPAPRGSGVRWATATQKGTLPEAFRSAIRETATATLRQGLLGWPVTDCQVTLVHNEFDNACSTGGDFRGLTPVIVMRALAAAGTAVFEPCHTFDVEVPADAFSAVTSLLTRAEANISATEQRRASWRIGGELPARRVPECQRELPGLTHGEGVWWSRPEGDRPVRGAAPRRERTDGNPLNTAAYLRDRLLRSAAR